MECLLAALLILTTGPVGFLDANPEAKRLYDDLLSNYNRLIRPVGNNSDRLTVKMGLKLSQLIDVVSSIIIHPSSSVCPIQLDDILVSIVMALGLHYKILLVHLPSFNFEMCPAHHHFCPYKLIFTGNENFLTIFDISDVRR